MDHGVSQFPNHLEQKDKPYFNFSYQIYHLSWMISSYCYFFLHNRLWTACTLTHRIYQTHKAYFVNEWQLSVHYRNIVFSCSCCKQSCHLDENETRLDKPDNPVAAELSHKRWGFNYTLKSLLRIYHNRYSRKVMILLISFDEYKGDYSCKHVGRWYHKHFYHSYWVVALPQYPTWNGQRFNEMI